VLFLRRLFESSIKIGWDNDGGTSGRRLGTNLYEGKMKPTETRGMPQQAALEVSRKEG